MMLVNRHPLPGPTDRRLEHRERIDWHDHAEHQLVYPRSGVLHVRTGRGAWVVPPRRAVWLPAGVAHTHRAHGRTHMLTLAFPADISPFDATEPTVLIVGQLLREVIITLAEDHALGPEDRADLYRIALRRLTPAPARQHHLPSPADPRLRDVAAVLGDDPADGRTLAELGRAVGAGHHRHRRGYRERLHQYQRVHRRLPGRLRHHARRLPSRDGVTVAGRVSAEIALPCLCVSLTIET
jgi:hypothetical protein